MFGRVRPGTCFSWATHRNTMISIQNRCDSSMSVTLSTRWLMARGGWASAGGWEPFTSFFGMVTSLGNWAVLYINLGSGTYASLGRGQDLRGRPLEYRYLEEVRV